MIDKLIISIANFIASNIKSTTIMKCALISLIVSIPLGLIFGIEVVVMVLVVNNIIWLTTEYLYSKDVEESTESD